MNYTHVDLQLDFAYCEYKVKEWGIRLCSSADNRLGYPNTLPHVFQTDEGNTLNEAGQGKISGGEDEVTEPSSKRMRVRTQHSSLICLQIFFSPSRLFHNFFYWNDFCFLQISCKKKKLGIRRQELTKKKKRRQENECGKLLL